MTIAIRELGAAKANIFANIVPVVTAFLSFLILKEPMPFIKVTGIIIVVAGLFMSQVGDIVSNHALKKKGLRHPPYS